MKNTWFLSKIITIAIVSMFSCQNYGIVPYRDDLGDILLPVATGAAIGGIAGRGRGAGIGAGVGVGVGLLSRASRRRYYGDPDPSYPGNRRCRRDIRRLERENNRLHRKIENLKRENDRLRRKEED